MDISQGRSPHGRANQLERVVWGLVWALLFRPSPRPLKRWRNFLVRLFGGRVAKTAVIYPTARIWLPRNLTMGEYSCLADGVEVYCLGPISIGDHTVISQHTYLCGGTHDHELPHFPLITKPITIGSQVWLAAGVFVAPGVSIGDGVVVGARSSVFRDLPAWKVCVGSPAKAVRDRVIRGTGA